MSNENPVNQLTTVWNGARIYWNCLVGRETFENISGEENEYSGK